MLDAPPKLSAQVRVFATGNCRKTDPVDAHSAAMVALRTANLVRVEVDDDLVVIGMLADHRDQLGWARNPASRRALPVDHRRRTRQHRLVPTGVGRSHDRPERRINSTLGLGCSDRPNQCRRRLVHCLPRIVGVVPRRSQRALRAVCQARRRIACQSALRSISHYTWGNVRTCRVGRDHAAASPILPMTAHHRRMLAYILAWFIATPSQLDHLTECRWSSGCISSRVLTTTF